MARFLVGDTLGSIKALTFTPAPSGSSEVAMFEAKTLLDGTSLGKSKAVQALACDGPNLITAVHADGSAAIYTPEGQGGLAVVHEWKEARFRKDSAFVGLSCSDGKIYTCTSNGALRLIIPPSDADSEPISQLATLPMRLKDWKLGPDGRTFAYGGDEVEVSLWDVERALYTKTRKNEGKDADPGVKEGKKRKRGDDLLPGEVWRAKNVANDELSLRVPVHNTSLAFLTPSGNEKNADNRANILAGTHIGAVRRYDTRAARKPVANWKEIVKTGPVQGVQRGHHEHEAFVSDHNSNLSAIDLRNGRILYTYKGIAATTTAHTPPLPYAPHLLASASNDRYIRFHSTRPPPVDAGKRQEQKGEVLCKAYVSVVPTCVVWDMTEGEWEMPVGKDDKVQGAGTEDDEESEEDVDEEDVWAGMEDVGDEEISEGEAGKRGKRRK